VRLHFRPRLASYYKAGAVLGAIFDAALEVGYRPHLRPSRSGFLVLEYELPCKRVCVVHLARHAARCGASARFILSCARDQVEVPF